MSRLTEYNDYQTCICDSTGRYVVIPEIQKSKEEEEEQQPVGHEEEEQGRDSASSALGIIVLFISLLH